MKLWLRFHLKSNELWNDWLVCSAAVLMASGLRTSLGSFRFFILDSKNLIYSSLNFVIRDLSVSFLLKSIDMMPLLTKYEFCCIILWAILLFSSFIFSWSLMRFYSQCTSCIVWGGIHLRDFSF
jgi:hypothetical protein